MTNTIPSFNFDALVTFNTAIADIDGAIIKYHNHHYAKKPRDPQSTTFRRHHFLPQCYPNKARVFIEQIPDNPEFWETVEPFDGVVKAIKEMYGAGIDVRIVVPLREVGRLGFILDWIEKWFGERYWTRRVIASDDLTFLKAKFLIDAHPVPEESAKLLNISGVGVVWEHVLFTQPYNVNVEGKRRLTDWTGWKSALGLDFWTVLEDGSPRMCFVHGSTDSKDIDVDYVFDEMPPQRLAHFFAQGVSDDRNIIVVKDGHIVEALKGAHDECNNALFTTYGLHEQKFECPIECKSTRVVLLKALSVVRKIVGSFAEIEELRQNILRILRSSNFQKNISYSTKVNYLQYPDAFDVHLLKSLAFQFSQTLALFKGKEIYTKQDAASTYPELSSFLYRDPEDIPSRLPTINDFKNELMEHINTLRYFFTGSFLLADYKGEIHTHLQQQCNNMIFTGLGELVFYGLDNDISLTADWPVDDLNITYNLNGFYINCTFFKTARNEVKLIVLPHLNELVTEDNFDVYKQQARSLFLQDRVIDTIEPSDLGSSDIPYFSSDVLLENMIVYQYIEDSGKILPIAMRGKKDFRLVSLS